MTKLKRNLIVLLVFILLIMNSVYAVLIYPDVENTKYEEAVTNIDELWIMYGYPDGTFGIDRKITKAQMARILVNCLALEDSANKMVGETKYQDAPANHWAAGYINVMSKYGYMDIEENENFYPDVKNVTFAEAVTYCVRMLGYGNAVDKKGNWPTNYLIKAEELGILDGVKLEPSEEITRGDLSILLWNTLNTTMRRTTSKSETLLESKFPNAEIYKKKYRVETIDDENGKVEVDKAEFIEDEELKITVIPNHGYELEELYIDLYGDEIINLTDKVKDNKITITCSKNDIKIKAKFKRVEIIDESSGDLNETIGTEKENKELENQFEDVKSEEWYYESVKYATTKGLFKGVSDNEFAPNVTMNRAMLVTVLHRLDGEKKTSYKNKFIDLADNAYYEIAVNWATKNNIVSGVSEKEFAPSNQVTREQLVVMLYRYAKLKGVNTSKKADLTSFEDYNEISDYAKDATAWAVKSGYINGRSGNLLAPKQTATRAEVATILMRFSEN